MREHFCQSSRYLRHLRQAPFAASIDALADKFHQLGCGRKYGRRILWIVGKFNDSERVIGIETAEGINEILMRHLVENLTRPGTYTTIAMRHAKPSTEVEFIMEPTSNAWFPAARWMKLRGFEACLVRPEKVADLRRYLLKHTKTDAIDAKALASMNRFDGDNLFPARLQSTEENACWRLCKQRARYGLQAGSIRTRIQDFMELAVPGLPADPDKILTSIQGIGPTIGPAIAARIGKITYFQDLNP